MKGDKYLFVYSFPDIMPSRYERVKRRGCQDLRMPAPNSAVIIRHQRLEDKKLGDLEVK